jgi:hypothetical protein
MEVAMTESGWRTLSGRLGWLIALTFVAGMALFALKLFHVIVPEPEFLGPDASFVDNLIASFEHQQEHWIENIGSSLLLAVGFIGIAILGSALRQALDREDARGAVLAVTFLLAGGLGAATQVLYLGATEVTTNPEYCDCGFLAEEIVSRSMIDQVVGSVIFWMTDASTALFAIGLLAFAGLAARSGWVHEGLALSARVVAILGLLTVLWDRIVLPAVDTGATDVDYGLIAGLVTIVYAGILIPIWAIWLARAAQAPAEPTEAPISTAD